MSGKKYLFMIAVLAIIALLGATYYLSASSKYSYENISPMQAKAMMMNQKVIVLDVRTPPEYSTQHIPGAISYPLLDLENQIPDFDKNGTTIVYCRTGVRSEVASRILSENGFVHIYNMLGGIVAWDNDGFPVVENSDCQICQQL